ncbi:MAG: DUF4843 domain-containing protein [Bacteroidia bacterium]|nr:DUF4843 domain-containing protein [Bacteroidia bacterium]
MKKHLIYILTFLMVITSCAKEEYLKYDTSQKDGVYLEYTHETDSVFFNFGFDSNVEHTFFVNCMLMGVPKDFDRKVSLKLSNEKYAGNGFIAAKPQYFSIPSEVTLAKDSVRVMIPVVLKRDVELETTRAILTIELLDSKDFEVRGHSEFTISFDDKTPPTPPWWASWSYGAFTKLKGQLFFKYFWEMEQENKAAYEVIVQRWGRNLDKTPNSGASSPLNTYRLTFMQYVQQKMWLYSQANPGLNLGISKPNFL